MLPTMLLSLTVFVWLSVVLGFVAAGVAGGSTYKALKTRKLGEDKKVPELAGLGVAVISGALVYTFWWAILIAGAIGGYIWLRTQRSLKAGKDPKGALPAGD
jgi:hypothetical protein